jgi:SAM-dependent methyltransferase
VPTARGVSAAIRPLGPAQPWDHLASRWSTRVCIPAARRERTPGEQSVCLPPAYRFTLGVMADTWTLFDRLADGYDEVVPFFTAFAVRLVELLDQPAGTRVLDVGSGRGAIAAALAARGCVVTAVDAAPRMVELLAAAHPAVDARVMDIHALDLPDDGYDLVTGGFVIHLVTEPTRVLAELRRVLRRGATVALTVPGPGEDSDRWDDFHALVREYEALATRPGRPGHQVEVPALLRRAGFTNVHATGITVHLSVADPETCWRFHMSHGFAGFVEALDPADAAQLRERALTEFACMHHAGGIVLDSGAVVHLATA